MFWVAKDLIHFGVTQRFTWIGLHTLTNYLLLTYIKTMAWPHHSLLINAISAIWAIQYWTLQWRIEKNVKGSGCGLFLGTLLAFASRAREKLWKPHEFKNLGQFIILFILYKTQKNKHSNFLTSPSFTTRSLLRAPGFLTPSAKNVFGCAQSPMHCVLNLFVVWKSASM